MTELPSQMPLCSFSQPGASFSPTFSAPHPPFAWSSTASNRSLPPRRSTSPPSNEHNGGSDGLLFITGTSLEDFKSRQNRTRVRKKAMGSYLKERKPRVLRKEQQYLSREESVGSRASIGSDQQDVIPDEEAARLVNEHSRRKSSQSISFHSSPIPFHGSPIPFHGSPVLHTRESPEVQVPHPYKMSMLPTAPVVVPSRTGVPLPYDEYEPPPLYQSIGTPFDPFNSMFQARHPRVEVARLKLHCSITFGTKAMGEHWIPTLVQSPRAFLSTLCIASVHKDAVTEQELESLPTLALRQEVMHLISENLVDLEEFRCDDYTIMALTQLIASEIIASEEWTEFALGFHAPGLEAMINERGGIEQLGVNGRLASTLSWVLLEYAILRETKAGEIYVDYLKSRPTRVYPNWATAPESPLYLPYRKFETKDFETLRCSTQCSETAMFILLNVHAMMQLFLDNKEENQHQWLQNIHKTLTTVPTTKKTIIGPNDWKFEVICITAILTATSIIERIPLSEALKRVAQLEVPVINGLSPTLHNGTSASAPTSRPTPPPTATLLMHLKNALKRSDLSNCWDDMAGVLLWVALTVGAASRKSEDKVLKKWVRALVIRVSIVLCFEHPEAIHATVLRMCEFIEVVGA